MWFYLAHGTFVTWRNFKTAILPLESAIIIAFGPARRLGPKVNRALLGLSAIALFCFGLLQLWLGIQN